MRTASLATSAAATPFVLFGLNDVLLDTSDAKRLELAKALNLPNGRQLKREQFACGDHYRYGKPCVDIYDIPHPVTEKLYAGAMESLVRRYPSAVRARDGMPELVRGLKARGWRIGVITGMRGLSEPIVAETLDALKIPYDTITATYGSDKLAHQLEADIIVDNEFSVLETAVRQHGKQGVLCLPAVGSTGYQHVQPPSKECPGLSIVRTSKELGALLPRLSVPLAA